MDPLPGRIIFLLLLLTLGAYTGKGASFQEPAFPKGPQLPKIEAPKVEMPKEEAPKIVMPKVQAPKITLPKAPQLPKDTAIKAKLLQRIANALKFTKNARANEQQRVITIINSMFADSMVTTARDIQRLNDELSQQGNQHFDTLLSLIQSLSAQRLADSATIAAGFNAAANTPVPEQDINELVNKILPLIQPKETQEKEDTAQQTRLSLIRSLYGRDPQQVDTLRMNDSIGIPYRLRLGHKALVIGLHPFWMEDRYLNYNFAALSTLSFYGLNADGRTGRIRNTLSPNSVKVLPAARQAGCGTLFTLYDTDIKNVTALLQHEPLQYLYIDSLFAVLQQQKATGVNIWFGSLGRTERNAFTRFVTLLASYFSHNSTQHYTISVTVPAYDQNLAYDLRALDTLCDHFLIDFTKPGNAKVAGALAPLKGDAATAIQPAVSRYLNMNIAPEKFILLLSYQGAEWKIGKNNTRDVFNRLVPYNEIRKNYPSDSAILYDEDETAALAEEKDEQGNVISQIWFDDATTLGLKYDYALRSKLGGVALWPMGADDGYTELWDEVTDKFTTIDTIRLDKIRLVPKDTIPLTFWQRVKVRFFFETKMLGMLLRSPCSVHANEYKSDVYFLYLTGFFLLCTLAALGFYAYNLRKYGSTWKWRRKVLWLFIVLLLLTLMCGVMELWLSKHIPWLGITDDPSTCHPITLTNVGVVFVVGVVLGMLIMRVFFFPMMRKDDMP